MPEAIPAEFDNIPAIERSGYPVTWQNNTLSYFFFLLGVQFSILKGVVKIEKGLA